MISLFHPALLHLISYFPSFFHFPSTLPHFNHYTEIEISKFPNHKPIFVFFKAHSHGLLSWIWDHWPLPFLHIYFSCFVFFPVLLNKAWFFFPTKIIFLVLLWIIQLSFSLHICPQMRIILKILIFSVAPFIVSFLWKLHIAPWLCTHACASPNYITCLVSYSYSCGYTSLSSCCLYSF